MDIQRFEMMLRGALSPGVARVGLDFNDHKADGSRAEAALEHGAYKRARWEKDEARELAARADSVWCLGWNSNDGSVRECVADATLAGCLELSGLASEADAGGLSRLQSALVSMLDDGSGRLSIEFEDRSRSAGGLARAIRDGDYDHARWVDEDQKQEAQRLGGAWTLHWHESESSGPNAICGASLMAVLAKAGLPVGELAAKAGEEAEAMERELAEWVEGDRLDREAMMCLLCDIDLAMEEPAPASKAPSVRSGKESVEARPPGQSSGA